MPPPLQTDSTEEICLLQLCLYSPRISEISPSGWKWRYAARLFANLLPETRLRMHYPTPHTCRGGGIYPRPFFLFEPRSTENASCSYGKRVHKRGATQLHIFQSCCHVVEKLQSQSEIIYGCCVLGRLKSSFSMLNVDQCWSCLETFCIQTQW